jgi:DNA/RNA endonuclease G (NUC1)
MLLLVLIGALVFCTKRKREDEEKRDVGFSHYPEGHPLPGTDNLRNYSAFLSSINFVTKLPNWVAEKLTISNLLENNLPPPPQPTECESPSSTSSHKFSRFFIEENTVNPRFRQTNDDYRNSGWSRGHLATASHHRTSYLSWLETFNLSANIVPQDPEMNADHWNRLEQFTISLLDYNFIVYVVSGPLWKPEIPLEIIGPRSVHVPSHLYKVIKRVNSETGDSETAAFVIPNEAGIPVNQEIDHFQVPLEEVENLTGLNLEGMKSKKDLCKYVTCNHGKSKRISRWKIFSKVTSLRRSKLTDSFKLMLIKQHFNTSLDEDLFKDSGKDYLLEEIKHSIFAFPTEQKLVLLNELNQQLQETSNSNIIKLIE